MCFDFFVSYDYSLFSPTTPVRSEALQGPVVDAESRTDVVTDQSQVDDLLASLGF